MHEPCLAESMHLGNVTTFSLRNQDTGDKIELTVDRNGDYSLYHVSKDPFGTVKTPIVTGEIGETWTTVKLNREVGGLL